MSIVPWLWFRLAETVDVHSGYDFPWGCLNFVKGRNSSAFHDWHHLYNTGTYGSMMCWMDRLMGTDKDYRLHYSKMHQSHQA